MSVVISRHVEFLASGGTCTTIEWADGGRATIVSMPDMPLADTSEPMRPRYSPGNAGFQRAMRIIDDKFHFGRITAADARQMEEDYITEIDREER
jgi:hypothetical protein